MEQQQRPRGAKAIRMDNNNSFNTGRPLIDFFLFLTSWSMLIMGKMFLLIGLNNIPLLLSCLVSICGLIKYGREGKQWYESWKNKRKRRKR